MYPSNERRRPPGSAARVSCCSRPAPCPNWAPSFSCSRGCDDSQETHRPGLAGLLADDRSTAPLRGFLKSRAMPSRLEARRTIGLRENVEAD